MSRRLSITSAVGTLAVTATKVVNDSWGLAKDEGQSVPCGIHTYVAGIEHLKTTKMIRRPAHSAQLKHQYFATMANIFKFFFQIAIRKSLSIAIDVTCIDTLITPNTDSFILASTTHTFTIRTPIYSINLILVAREIHCQFSGLH